MVASRDQQQARSRLTGLFDLCGLVSAIIFGAIAIMVTLDLVTRNLHLADLVWVNEVTEYMVTFGTFIGAPWVLHHHGHVNIDILVSHLPSPARLAMERVCDGLGFIICAAMFYESVRVLLDTYAAGSLVFKNLVFPEWYLSTPTVVCYALCTLEFASRFMPRAEVTA